MADPIEYSIAVVTALFGAGAAWGALRHSIKTTETRASTAIQQSDTALAKNAELKLEIANERTERAKLEGKLYALEREAQIREEFRLQNAELSIQTSYLEAIAKRTGSVPAMRAAHAPVPRGDPPSDPPVLPPMRQKLPSRRGYGGE